MHKDPTDVEVSVALAFPDVYEVGMSHLGLKILYHLLNRESWLAAERVFCPWVDMEDALRAHGRALTSLESGTPLSEFDIVGFSLQNELTWTNVLTMLDLAGIPLLARDRNEAHPLIIGGGPACFNAEPMAEFFDLLVVGDGEETALQVCRSLRKAKREGPLSKQGFLLEICRIPGVYIPSFFEAVEGPDGRSADIRSLVPGYPHVTKAIAPDLGAYPFPDRQVVPFTELVHDRLAVEISRGCTRGCRFCQAGMIYRPVRERSPQAILEIVRKSLAATGYDDLSLLSLSSGDYTCIEPLLRALMDRLSPEKIALSLPSLRVDSLNPAIMEEIKRVRKTGFTLAVEAGTPRLRAVLNKGLTDNEILEIAGAAYRAGWRLIKLYFMVGLPSETEEDLLEIPRISERIARLAGKRGGKPRLNVSLSTFVPKPHTPFQWACQISLEEIRKRMALIQREIQGTAIRVKWNSPELSWLEGILARGDRRLGRAIWKAWSTGARFDAWTERFSLETWRKALDDAGLDPDSYLRRERAIDEVLPWDHIHSGVSKDYLAEEWRKAKAALPTPDCRGGCLECGVCDHARVRQILVEQRLVPEPRYDDAGEVQKVAPTAYRILFSKRGAARFLSHLELTRVFVRAFRRCKVPFAYSSGFHPLPKMAFLTALPVGTESLGEILDIETKKALDITESLKRIREELPQGMEILSMTQMDPRRPRGRIVESRYRIRVKGTTLGQDALERFLRADRFPVDKHTQKGNREVDARPLVASMALVSSDTVELVIAHGNGPELKPGEIVTRVFSLDETLRGEARIVKVGQALAQERAAI